MPTSDYANIEPIMSEIHRLQPERMIELGIGCGKYGALCRETLDGIYGRVTPDKWARTIHGVDVFRAYGFGPTGSKNPCWDCYDEVEIGDFSTMDIAGWDLVLMVDSLEHLSPQIGEKFLAHLVESNRHVIISVPNGHMPQDEPVYGNPYERHLTTYYGREFNRYDPLTLHLGLCRVVSIKGKL